MQRDPEDEATTVLEPTEVAESSSGQEPADRGEVAVRVSNELADGPLVTIGVLGEGGMAEVHLARDATLGRKVALKRMRSIAAGRPDLVRRFVAEAQLTAQLEHPNIVPVYAVEAAGNADGPSYTMKVIRGKTLSEILADAKAAALEGRPAPEHASRTILLEHFEKVCDAVAYAHHKGVVHRDLKPSNVMVGRFGEVYVVDWGIAKVSGQPDEANASSTATISPDDLELGDQQTRVGTVMGSPRYMSPEQAAGDVVLDLRSDVFSLGLILFEICTLRPALEGHDADTVLLNALAGRIRAIEPISGAPPVPRELRAVIGRATTRRPDDRYASAAELAEDVRRHLRGEAVVARPDTPIQALVRRASRNASSLLVVILGLLGLVLAITSWSQWRHEMAAAESRAREQRLGAFVAAVATKAAAIDRELLAAERALEAFATSVTQALEHGEPSEERLWMHEAFASKTTGPPDLAPAPRFGALTSFDHPAILVPPTADVETNLAAARRAMPLRHAARRLLLEGDAPAADGLDAAATRRLLAETGTTISWIYFGLESGLFWVMPGQVYVDGFDPRERPWYRLSAGRPGRHWGNPYVEAATRRLVLPCSRSLFDSSGELLGVASLDLTFEAIIDRGMSPAGIPGVTEAFLLDGEGRIVIRSTDARQEATIRSLSEGKATPRFPDERLLARLGDVGGYVEGREALYGYAPLSAPGWHLVVAAGAS